MNRAQHDIFKRGLDSLCGMFGSERFPDFRINPYRDFLKAFEPSVIESVFSELCCNTRYHGEITLDRISDLAYARGSKKTSTVSKINPNCKACRGHGHVNARRVAGKYKGYTAIFGCPEGCSPTPSCLMTWDFKFVTSLFEESLWELTWHHQDYAISSGHPPVNPVDFDVTANATVLEPEVPVIPEAVIPVPAIPEVEIPVEKPKLPSRPKGFTTLNFDDFLKREKPK